MPDLGDTRAELVHAVLGTARTMTGSIAGAEGDRFERDPMRVWVFAAEIPHGTWGGAGRIARLADIAGFVFGDVERGREYAEQRLAERQAAGV